MNNTGDLLHDVIDTLNMFNEEDINQIISDYYSGKKIVFLYRDDYEIIPTLNVYDRITIYNRNYTFDIKEILYNIVIYNSNKYLKLLNTFNNKYIYATLVAKDEIDFTFINLCFEILSNEEIYNKFIDFDNNKELFSLNNLYNQEHYLLEMMKYFEQNKNLVIIKDIQFNFNFTTNEFIERYNKLKNMITISNKTKEEESDFLVNEGYPYSFHKQKYIDNDWNLDKSIEHYVLDGMNSDYSLEEQIAHIYIKLCVLLEYEGSYMVDTNINSLYSKNIMEGINVDNPVIICSDFTHLFTKLVNKLENVDARSVRCGKGNRVHEYAAILIKDKNTRVDFDPIDVHGNFNDLTSAKLGIELKGIQYIKDDDNTFRNAVQKVYNHLISQNTINTYYLINEYEKLNFRNISVDFSQNIYRFLEQMKIRNIRGNELIIAFMRMENIGYFGNINYSLAYYRHEDNYMERVILFESNNKLFYFRTSTQDIIEFSKEELNNFFNENVLSYEDDKYKLEGVGIIK